MISTVETLIKTKERVEYRVKFFGRPGIYGETILALPLSPTVFQKFLR